MGSLLSRNVKETPMEEDPGEFVFFQYEDETREMVELRAETRLIMPTNKNKKYHFDTDFFHGNYVKFPNNFKMILTQAPFVNTPGKKSTAAKFWYTVKKEKVKTVIMLCDFVEDGKVKCDKYFPLEVDETLTFGIYSIKCTKMVKDGDLVTRTLVLSIDGEPNHVLTHYQYTGWPENGGPITADTVVKMLVAVRNIPETVIVHSSLGTGRAGSFAFIELAYQTVCINNDGTCDLPDVLRRLRKMRAHAIPEPFQFAFCVLANFELLFYGESLEDPKYATEKGMLDSIRDGWKYSAEEKYGKQK